jgi:hypothetical protein
METHAALHAADEITDTQLIAGTKVLKERLAQVRAEGSGGIRAVRVMVPAGLPGHRDLDGLRPGGSLCAAAGC